MTPAPPSSSTRIIHRRWRKPYSGKVRAEYDSPCHGSPWVFVIGRTCGFRTSVSTAASAIPNADSVDTDIEPLAQLSLVLRFLKQARHWQRALWNGAVHSIPIGGAKTFQPPREPAPSMKSCACKVADGTGAAYWIARANPDVMTVMRYRFTHRQW